MNEEKRRFRFYMTDIDGQEFESDTLVYDYCDEFETELSYLLDQFKKFLLLSGYSEMTVSKL